MGGPPAAPDGLSARARAFWCGTQDGRTLGLIEQEMLVEAARLITRADQLDDRLRECGPEAGEEWRSLLVEARLTAVAVRGVLAELRQQMGPAAPGLVAEEDPLDELGARRKDRLAGPEGR